VQRAASRLCRTVLALGSLTLACDTTPSNDSRAQALMSGSVDHGDLITLARAVELAHAEIPGAFALEAELELEDDDENEPPAYEVTLLVLDDGRVLEVEVHAQTGAVLEIEEEDDLSEAGGDDEEDD